MYSVQLLSSMTPFCPPPLVAKVEYLPMSESSTATALTLTYLHKNDSSQYKSKNCHWSFLWKVLTGVDTYKCFTSCLLLFKTYFLIVFHSYHVTYYLYLHCLFFNVMCFEINWIELNWILYTLWRWRGYMLKLMIVYNSTHMITYVKICFNALMSFGCGTWNISLHRGRHSGLIHRWHIGFLFVISHQWWWKLIHHVWKLKTPNNILVMFDSCLAAKLQKGKLQKEAYFGGHFEL